MQSLTTRYNLKHLVFRVISSVMNCFRRKPKVNKRGLRALSNYQSVNHVFVKAGAPSNAANHAFVKFLNFMKPL